MKEITCYKCEAPGCRKVYQKKFCANKHAKECWRDPANRSCLTCVHHDFNHFDGNTCEVDLLDEPTDEHSGRFCGALPINCEQWEAKP